MTASLYRAIIYVEIHCNIINTTTSSESLALFSCVLIFLLLQTSKYHLVYSLNMRTFSLESPNRHFLLCSYSNCSVGFFVNYNSYTTDFYLHSSLLTRFPNQYKSYSYFSPMFIIGKRVLKYKLYGYRLYCYTSLVSYFFLIFNWAHARKFFKNSRKIGDR